MKILNILFERGFTANLLLSLDPYASPGDIDEERAKMYRFVLKELDIT
jgi:hypothetical protein